MKHAIVKNNFKMWTFRIFITLLEHPVYIYKNNNNKFLLWL